MQRLNRNLHDIGVSPITSCPLPTAVPTVVGLSAVADFSSQSLVISFTGTTDANVVHKVFASPGLSAGINSAGTRLRMIGTIPGATAATSTQTTEYIAKFGAVPAVGTKIFIEITPVDDSTGIAGAKTIFSCVVTA